VRAARVSVTMSGVDPVTVTTALRLTSESISLLTVAGGQVEISTHSVVDVVVLSSVNYPGQLSVIVGVVAPFEYMSTELLESHWIEGEAAFRKLRTAVSTDVTWRLQGAFSQAKSKLVTYFTSAAQAVASVQSMLALDIALSVVSVAVTEQVPADLQLM